MYKSIIKEVIKNEGGYVNDPLDSGGETKYGISKRSYPNLQIKALTQTQAEQIYFRDYWNDYYSELKTYFAYKMLDLGVNLGTKQAVKILQRVIKVKVDGIFGEKTLIKTIENQEENYIKFILAVKKFYEKIAVKTNNRFLKGWINRLEHNPFL